MGLNEIDIIKMNKLAPHQWYNDVNSYHKLTRRSIRLRPKGLPNHSEFSSLGMNLGIETGWWRSGLNISVLELLQLDKHVAMDVEGLFMKIMDLGLIPSSSTKIKKEER